MIGEVSSSEAWTARHGRSCTETVAILSRKRLPTPFPFPKYANFLEVVSREGKARSPGCADDENGYCQERTAWVSNLLALDFYRIALTKPEEKRKGDLCQAVKHAEGVLKLRKQGFRDPLQGVPTQDLLDDARKQLAGLGPCQ